MGKLAVLLKDTAPPTSRRGVLPEGAQTRRRTAEQAGRYGHRKLGGIGEENEITRLNGIAC